MRPFAPPALVVVALAAAGCARGGDLETDLEAPAVAISADEHWRELAFVARAETSAPLVAAEVRVLATCELDAPEDARGLEEGQVRVMLARDALEDDHGRGEDVLALETGAEAVVPRAAFEGCTGACEEEFLVVFSAEGVPAGLLVEVPVRLEATLLYEGEAPAEDSVTLELLP